MSQAGGPGQRPAHLRRQERAPPTGGNEALPTPRAPAHAGSEPSGTLSKRKQKSAARLKEFQQQKRLFLLWRRTLHKIARVWRHERMWRVHNAWYATRSASAEAAGPPALDTERMEEDHSTTRAVEPAEMGESSSSAGPPRAPRSDGEHAPLQPGTGAAGVPCGGGMNAAAPEFVPGLPMAVVEAHWRAAVDGLIGCDPGVG